MSSDGLGLSGYLEIEVKDEKTGEIKRHEKFHNVVTNIGQQFVLANSIMKLLGNSRVNQGRVAMMHTWYMQHPGTMTYSEVSPMTSYDGKGLVNAIFSVDEQTLEKIRAKGQRFTSVKFINPFNYQVIDNKGYLPLAYTGSWTDPSTAPVPNPDRPVPVGLQINASEEYAFVDKLIARKYRYLPGVGTGTINMIAMMSGGCFSVGDYLGGQRMYRAVDNFVNEDDYAVYFIPPGIQFDNGEVITADNEIGLVSHTQASSPTVGITAMDIFNLDTCELKTRTFEHTFVPDGFDWSWHYYNPRSNKDKPKSQQFIYHTSCFGSKEGNRLYCWRKELDSSSSPASFQVLNDDGKQYSIELRHSQIDNAANSNVGWRAFEWTVTKDALEKAGYDVHIGDTVMCYTSININNNNSATYPKHRCSIWTKSDPTKPYDTLVDFWETTKEMIEAMGGTLPLTSYGLGNAQTAAVANCQFWKDNVLIEEYGADQFLLLVPEWSYMETKTSVIKGSGVFTGYVFTDIMDIPGSMTGEIIQTIPATSFAFQTANFKGHVLVGSPLQGYSVTNPVNAAKTSFEYKAMCDTGYNCEGFTQAVAHQSPDATYQAQLIESHRVKGYEQFSHPNGHIWISRDSWAGDLVSYKLLDPPVEKGPDDSVTITYGYEISGSST